MAFPSASSASVETSSGESAINDLLSVGLETPETEVQPGGDTPVTEPETEVEVEPEVQPEGEEAPPEETEDVSEEGGEEEESGEDEFEASNLETDFSDATYAKAAKHWAGRGVELDPANNEGHRAFLKDWLQRGQKIAELQASQATKETPEETTEQPAETQQPTKTPQQLLEDRITGVKAYAKETVNPHVARELVLPGLTAIASFFWGKDKAVAALANKSDADLAEVTEALTAMMAIQIADAVPQIVAATPQAVSKAYPYMSKMHEMAEKEAAVDEILDAADAQGNPIYPNFDKLVENGAINKALASPELKNAVFDRDPYKNRIAKLKFAYKIARNERVDPKMLAEASKRGRASEKERQQRVAAGRNSPGSSSRTNTQTRSSFVQNLVGTGESPSAKLFRNVGRRAE